MSHARRLRCLVPNRCDLDAANWYSALSLARTHALPVDEANRREGYFGDCQPGVVPGYVQAPQAVYSYAPMPPGTVMAQPQVAYPPQPQGQYPAQPGMVYPAPAQPVYYT